MKGNFAEWGLATSETATDERQLVEAAQRDPARFADLYERNFERVYAFVARRVSCRAEAEDITADVFHQALRKIGAFEWRSVPFVAWLYRIAANEIVDRARDSARQTDPPADIPDEKGMAAIEARASVFRLVESLPQDQRRVVEMRFGEEKSVREIAELMGRSEGAIKQLQFRALQALRARVTPNRAESGFGGEEVANA